MVPGLGEIADGLNAIMYLAEGDKTNAALSAAAMIPFVGWAATATKAGTQIWSKTRRLSSVENAFQHWKKHGPEFPELNNSKEYVTKVMDFMHGFQPGQTTQFRSNGDLLKYQESTNTFGVIDKDGIPRTLFKPTDGKGYWDAVKDK